MRKIITVMLVIFSFLLMSNEKNVGTTEKKANTEYGFYSGKSLGGNFKDSFFIVIPEKKVCYTNLDKIKTDQDLEIGKNVCELAGMSDSQENTEFMALLSAVSIKIDYKEKGQKPQKLSEEFLEIEYSKSGKNEKVLKNVSEKKILFFYLNMTEDIVSNGMLQMTVGD